MASYVDMPGETDFVSPYLRRRLRSLEEVERVQREAQAARKDVLTRRASSPASYLKGGTSGRPAITLRSDNPPKPVSSNPGPVPHPALEQAQREQAALETRLSKGGLSECRRPNGASGFTSPGDVAEAGPLVPSAPEEKAS